MKQAGAQLLPEEAQAAETPPKQPPKQPKHAGKEKGGAASSDDAATQEMLRRIESGETVDDITASIQQGIMAAMAQGADLEADGLKEGLANAKAQLTDLSKVLTALYESGDYPVDELVGMLQKAGLSLSEGAEFPQQGTKGEGHDEL